MKKLLIALVLLTSFFTGYGQDSTVVRPNNFVTFGFSSYLYTLAPRFDLGYNRKISDRIWVGTSIGYGKQFLKNNEGPLFLTKKHYKLYEVRPEVYYDLRPDSKLKHLLSVEFFYIYHENMFQYSWYNSTDGNRYRFDQADFKRIKTGANINYSLLYYFNDRFGIIQKVGLGFRHRHVDFTNIENPSRAFEWNRNDLAYRRNEGSANGLNLNLDFKLFYKF